MNNYQPYYAVPQSRASEATLMQRVSYMLCTMLLFTAGAAWWAGMAGLPPGLFLPLAIGTFACVIAISFTRTKPVISVILLYVLSVLEGLLIGPMLGAIAHGYALGSTIIAESATISAVLVAGLGTYVWISNKDFGFLGKTLFWALIGLIVIGVISWFVNFGPAGSLLYAFIGAAIFIGFTLYDFSNIKRRYGPEDFALATVALYLDFLNLFLFILKILMLLSGGGGRSRD